MNTSSTLTIYCDASQMLVGIKPTPLISADIHGAIYVSLHPTTETKHISIWAITARASPFGTRATQVVATRRTRTTLAIGISCFRTWKSYTRANGERELPFHCNTEPSSRGTHVFCDIALPIQKWSQVTMHSVRTSEFRTSTLTIYGPNSQGSNH